MKPSFVATFRTAALLTAFMATSATAQLTKTDIPDSAQPGRLEQQLPAPDLSDLATTPGASDPKPLTAPANAQNVIFTLQSISFDGMTAYKEVDLNPYYKNQIGEEVTLADMYVLADLLTLKMREDGYLMTSVIIPPQEITGGSVKMKVIEGHISKIVVENDDESDLSNDALAFADSVAQKLAGMKPLTAEALERHLLLINDLPGITARAVLESSASVAEAADMTIFINRKEVEGFAQVDNRGTRYIGPVQGQGGIVFNGVFSDHDQLAFRYSQTLEASELRFVEVAHKSTLNNNGLSLTLKASSQNSEPGHSLKSFDVETSTKSVSAKLSYPVIRGREENLEVYGSFTYRDTETDSQGSALTEDHLRVVSAGATYNKQDAFLKGGLSTVDVSISKGLDILDASDDSDPLATRTDGKADFVKVNATVTRTQSLTEDGKWSLFGAAETQLTNDALLASEEYGLGGTFGSAYDSSEVTGDVGVAAKVELRYDNAVDKWKHLDAYQAYIYYDGGVVRDIDKIAGQNTKRTLMSAGIGTRLYLPKDVTASFELAKPLTRPVATAGTNGNSIRAFFSLAKQF